MGFRKNQEETNGTQGFFFHKLSGWWYTYPSEKYESQLGLLFPICGKKEMFQTTNQLWIVKPVDFPFTCGITPNVKGNKLQDAN